MKKGTSLKVVVAAFLANLFIAGLKFAAALFTRSSAMMAESVHSTADTLNQVLLLIGIKRGEKKADELHPFGFSLETYFWSFIVAIFLFTAGALFSIYEGIHKIRHPHPLENVQWAIGVLAFSIIAESLSFRVVLKQLQKEKGREKIFRFLKRCKKAELLVVFLEDLAALAGLVIALGLIILEITTGILFFDALASILIGVLLAVVAIFLGYETKSLLIGESADPGLLKQVYALLHQEENIKRIIHIRSLQLGAANILLAVKIEFDERLNTVQISNQINAIEKDIRSEFPDIKKIYIEPDIYQPAEACFKS